MSSNIQPVFIYPICLKMPFYSLNPTLLTQLRGMNREISGILSSESPLPLSLYPLLPC